MPKLGEQMYHGGTILSHDPENMRFYPWDQWIGASLVTGRMLEFRRGEDFPSTTDPHGFVTSARYRARKLGLKLHSMTYPDDPDAVGIVWRRPEDGSRQVMANGVEIPEHLRS